MRLEASDDYNISGYPTDDTWQCWMVNTLTGEEKLLTYDHWSEWECKLEANRIFAQWDDNPYPSSEGWMVVYRQDSPLKMAQYWRDYYQERANYWSKRYKKVLREHNQHRRQIQQFERQQVNPIARAKKLRRRRRVRARVPIPLAGGYKRLFRVLQRIGGIFAGTLLFAIAPELIVLFKESPKDPLNVARHTTDIPLSVRELFKSQDAPGAIAVGVAEGNLTPSGEPTSTYSSGHTDPGNFATNRGFCSWNKANDISIEEANERCLEALQLHSIATENQLLDLGIESESMEKAIVMGTDLWNQSNTAGPNFPFAYKAAKDKGLNGQQAYIWARVEAFRNEQQQLDASGLFGICKREPYYKQQLTGLMVDSEEWRWNCIKLDQMRRVLEIEKVFQ